MIKNISYRILPRLNLVVENYVGMFGVHDYIELKKSQLEDKEFNPLYNNIADIRNAQIEASNEDIKVCIDFMKSANGLIGKRRSAVITATPDQVVFSTLFARYGNGLPMQFEIVSTLAAAIEWAEISPTDYLQVESVLTEMNKNAVNRKTGLGVNYQGI